MSRGPRVTVAPDTERRFVTLVTIRDWGWEQWQRDYMHDNGIYSSEPPLPMPFQTWQHAAPLRADGWYLADESQVPFDWTYTNYEVHGPPPGLLRDTRTFTAHFDVRDGDLDEGGDAALIWVSRRDAEDLRSAFEVAFDRRLKIKPVASLRRLLEDRPDGR